MDGYHYTECGLDNVWLTNGYEVQSFGEYGDGVSVQHEQALWGAIAASIVRQDAAMTGQEFRFLRGLLDLTQAGVGRRLGHKDHQTVLRWERGRRMAVPLAADVLMRSWYLESVGERPMVTRISQRLAEIGGDVAGTTSRVLAEQPDGGWTTEGAPREMALV